MKDVVVIGAGPAGSTAAALLAQAGHTVTVIEKETFPRFHIGESLIPAELPILERLGVSVDGIPAVFKRGADFIDERTGDFARYNFEDGLPGTPAHAYQVERAGFDARLLGRAIELGAERVKARAKEVRFTEDHVEVETDSGVHRARFLIDATGRDKLLARQLKSHERIDGFGLAAVWRHYEDLSDEAVRELETSGNIIVVMLAQKGWAWVIPLSGQRLSVGFVSAEPGVTTDAWYDAQFAASPLLQRLTKGAREYEAAVAGDYSYKNTRAHGARYACIGDASCFLDPVFSSGVALAMTSAQRLADLLAPALADHREAEPALMAPLASHMQRAYDVFSAMIWSFYHTKMVHNMFFYDDPDLEIRAGLISVLAGDVWREDNKFQKMILNSSRRRQKRKVRARA